MNGSTTRWPLRERFRRSLAPKGRGVTMMIERLGTNQRRGTVLPVNEKLFFSSVSDRPIDRESHSPPIQCQNC